jgi:hypothetical protein
MKRSPIHSKTSSSHLALACERAELARQRISLQLDIQRKLRLIGWLLQSHEGFNRPLSRAEVLLARELAGVPEEAKETDENEVFAMRLAANVTFFSEARMKRIWKLLEDCSPIWAKGQFAS